MAICKTIYMDGYSMPVAQFGRGEKALIILPGVSVDNTTSYADAVEQSYWALKEAYTIYLMDRRQEVPEGYSLEDMARDTLAVLDRLGVGTFSVMGASQGGMIGLYLAAIAPNRVEKMLLASASWYLSDMAQKLFGSWAAFSASNEKMRLAQAFVDHVYSQKRLQAQRDSLIESILPYTEAQLARFSILCQAFFTADLDRLLPMISCDCYVVGAEGDQVYGIDFIRELAERLHCKSYFFDAQTGHALYDEEPTFFSAHLFPFFLD